MAKVQARVETALERFLPSAAIAPQRLHDAMRYAVLGGGKRIRPLLTFAAGEASAGEPVRADPSRLEIAACAVECIHAYSLVHDDLPCMDDDVLRRGKPASHIEFDEATALLVGDSLQSLAFQLLAEHHLSDDPAVQVEMVKILAAACGSRDMESSTATLGKTVGKDAANNKPTYVSALGLARARALAEELREEAQAAISDLRGGARRLAELADFIVLRKF